MVAGWSMKIMCWHCSSVRVVDDGLVGIDVARTQLLEQTDLGGRAGSSVDPDSEGRILRIAIACFEEPEEDVLVIFDVYVSREALDVGVGLAGSGRDLLVSYGDV